MEAARLLYGELELDADKALQTVAQVDNGLDALKEIIEANMAAMQSMTSATESVADALNNFSGNTEEAEEDVGMFSEQIKSSEGFLKSFYTTLNSISKMSALDFFMFFANILIGLIQSAESFEYAIEVLKDAFEPLLDIVKDFAEFLAGYLLSVFISIVNVLSEVIQYLTETEQGLALLKIAAIFFAVVAGVALVASLKAMAVAAYGAMTAFIAMITPLLPFIAIAALVAAAITTVILVLEDLYYFATGEGESVAGGFFAALGMSPEEIEEVRKSIKEFIDIVKSSWESFTKGVEELVPQFKKIFSALLAIAESFFITVFKYVFDLAKIFSGVWDIIKGIFTGNFDLILGGFKKIADGILSIFKSMGNFIADIFNNLIEMIAPLKDIASSIFGGKAPAPIAGARAEGGSVASGKSYLVGEKGAEIFTPSTGGSITPNSQISAAPSTGVASSGKSGLSVVIQNVSIMVQGGANMADDFKSQFSELLRQACIEAGQELGLEI